MLLVVVVFYRSSDTRPTWDTRVRPPHERFLRPNVFGNDLDTRVSTKPHLRFFTIATLLKNKRRWLREWIEFYLMMGAEHFIIYDNGSTDIPLEVLQIYIDRGQVTYVPWPPLRVPSPPRQFKSALEKWQYSWFKDALETCLSGHSVIHQQVPCQLAAFADAIRLTKNGGSRWLANLDVEEYMFPRLSSQAKSLVEVLRRDHGDTDHIKVYGHTFGTSGRGQDTARRKLGEPLHPLMTESYIYRAPDDGTLLLDVTDSRS